MRTLSDVTICAADCAHPALAARALRKSLEQCEFADAILFSDVPVPGPFRNVAIPALVSRFSYSEFVLRQLASYISTPFVLIVQWDGYVLSSREWRSEFTRYDYVGAEWPWHKDGMSVGNGGFSFRSRRLLDLTASPTFELVADRNEDELICRVHRSHLEEKYGIRIAPTEIANMFAYERALPNNPTFGFHGVFNMWRHVEDGAMTNIVRSLNVSTLRSREIVELLAQYVSMRKFTPAIEMFAKIQSCVAPSDLDALFQRSLGSAAYASQLKRECEKLVAAA